MRKYNKSITIYQKDTLEFAVLKLLQRLFILHCKLVKNLRKRIVALSFFVLCLGKFFGEVLLKIHNVLENPQILQHKFLILLQQPKSATKESLSSIFVASEQGLDASA